MEVYERKYTHALKHSDGTYIWPYSLVPRLSNYGGGKRAWYPSLICARFSGNFNFPVSSISYLMHQRAESVVMALNLSDSAHFSPAQLGVHLQLKVEQPTMQGSDIFTYLLPGFGKSMILSSHFTLTASLVWLVDRCHCCVLFHCSTKWRVWGRGLPRL